MRIHWLQHVPFEGLGSMEGVLCSAGHDIAGTRLFQEHTLPGVHEFDCLIVMGGPMGVGDEDQYPWLVEEKRFVASAIEQEKIVLGICLGAQLIAEVAGARIFGNDHKEIGWFPIQRTEVATTTATGRALLPAIDAFHWHGDTFDLPTGAVHLAQSAACKNQAFALGDRVVALQFHLETTQASAEALIEHCGDELDDSPYVQSAETILSDNRRFVRINDAMQVLLDQFMRE
ncbi:MAG TPA: amidotransferase [Candidatus Latescibacteria bacterium]|jgi:GMP synthase (glutamine-hydrolysing)|nr:amidotransferase [Candidatus Latescibacterota bacterium]HJN66791.1 hypothetical protein [Pirellulales bacterium]